MNAKDSLIPLLASLCILLPGIGYAETHQHQAHVHGLAELTLAVEDKQLEIEFTSPAANLLGFEHAAHTESEKQALKQTTAQLKQALQLFAFAGANCTLQQQTIIVPPALSGTEKACNHHDEAAHKDHDSHKAHQEHHEHSEHKREKHDDEHHQGHHDDHSIDHSDAHKEDSLQKDNHHKNQHSDISASYAFSCTGQPTSVDVSLFKLFPNIESINAMWITTNRQGSEKLSAKHTRINLR